MTTVPEPRPPASEPTTSQTAGPPATGHPGIDAALAGLVLGKPLGVGILSAALKKEMLGTEGYDRMIATTTQLNTPGPELAALPGVTPPLQLWSVPSTRAPVGSARRAERGDAETSDQRGRRRVVRLPRGSRSVWTL